MPGVMKAVGGWAERPYIGFLVAAPLGLIALIINHSGASHGALVGIVIGALEGIASTESANPAVSGANLIPLLTLCIVGIYVSQGVFFAVWLRLAFAVLGFWVIKLDLSVVCFIMD